jgi:molybdopterin-guanine dinucleotide biosynthesis protein A
MMAPQNKITGILLAGGESKRMGRDKGKIKIGKHYLFSYPLKILETLCDEILISRCSTDKLPVEHTHICDDIPGIGPLGGIYTCLKKSSNKLNIVLSCDLPLVNEELVRHMLTEAGKYDILVPALMSDKPEPLCGIYHKHVGEKMLELIENKTFAVHKILPLVASRTILIDESMPFYHSDIFLNINRSEDLTKLASKL